MNIKFTVEESNLISTFEGKNRKVVIQSILDIKKYLDDTEVLEKLDGMSDEEFMAAE